MKKTISIILLAVMTVSSFAQDTTKKKDAETESSGSGSYGKCEKDITGSAAKRAEDKEKNSGRTNKVVLNQCEKLNLISKVNKTAFSTANSSATLDGRIVCQQRGGYTLDYNDCKRVKQAYDSVFLAEKGMFATQTIALNENSTKQNKTVAAAAASGDIQNAALQATADTNKKQAELNKQQVVIYSSAVTALGSAIGAWQTKKESKLKKMCTEQKAGFIAEAKNVHEIDGLDEATAIKECTDIMVENKQNIFSNDGARNQFVAAGTEYFQKALAARKRAGINETIANAIQNSAAMNDDEDLMVDPCLVDATSAACTGSQNPSISSGTFEGNTVDFGAGATGQNFDFNNPDGTAIGSTGSSDGTGSSKVGDISSPFEAQAKAAKGILNPASAATLSPGAQPTAPGGGGGGGGGGGHASLGDDLQGADVAPNKEADINSSKVTGKYKESSGGGFQGVKSSKDENPFASLFDSKAEGGGGIEEDRSIASGGGEASGIFQKISKKYGQVQQEKRVESQNAE